MRYSSSVWDRKVYILSFFIYLFTGKSISCTVNLNWIELYVAYLEHIWELKLKDVGSFENIVCRLLLMIQAN